MVCIVQRQPRRQFRDALIGLLVGEVSYGACAARSVLRLAADDVDSLRAALESIQRDRYTGVLPPELCLA
jgi:hypothetical protein